MTGHRPAPMAPGPAASPGAGRSWWPDRRPVRTWEAWLAFGIGTLFVALGGLQLVMAEAWGGNGEYALFQLVVGASFLGQSGLQVARPGPARGQVVLYRTAWLATVVPVLLAGSVVFFG